MSEQRGFQYFGKTPSGVEMALSLEVDAGMAPKNLADYLKAIDAELKDAGFTRSDRLEKPAGGWGGRPGMPRPEEQPPADLVVPEHCGEPMIYKPERPAQGDRKAVAPRWECRKGRNCAEAEERGGNKYGATNWHMTKKPAQEPADGSPKGDPHPPATRNGSRAASTATRPTAADFGAFWPKVRALGYTSEQVQHMAGKPVPDLTRAELAALWEKLKAAAAGVAVS